MKNRILIIDIDSKMPNLALKKIEKYHQNKGDEVIWNVPLFRECVDKIYVSCIFTKNKHKCKEWKGSEIGGTGYSLKKTLPKEIEEINPRINLGFTTRGCIRNCSFCVVPEKEGKMQRVGDLLDLWDGKTKDITVLDNNILADPEHFELICKQAKENKIRVDFNQGLDHRLLTQDMVTLMKSISHKQYRFAFDYPSYKPMVERALILLKNGGIKRVSWYILVGFNTTPQEDLDRCNFLRDAKQDVYIQRYKTCEGIKFYTALAKWGNQHGIFKSMTWKQFLLHPSHAKRYAELLKI